MAFVIEDAAPGTVGVSPDIRDMANRYGAEAPKGGYVIEDATPGSVSPDTWIKAGVAKYHEHRADKVIGETNNGGKN